MLQKNYSVYDFLKLNIIEKGALVSFKYCHRMSSIWETPIQTVCNYNA